MQTWIAIHEGEVRLRIGHTEMRDHDVEFRLRSQDPFDACDAGAHIVLPRNRTCVHEQETAAPCDFRVDGAEPYVVGRQTLDVFVQLEADATIVECVDHVANASVIIQVYGRKRQAEAREFTRRSCEPCIEFARHTGLVCVTAKHEALDARSSHHRGDFERIGGLRAQIPSACGEPAADRGKESGRMQVRVNVDHGLEIRSTGA